MREENEEWNSVQISDKEGGDDDDSSEPGDYAILKNTDDLSTSSEDDSETFSSKDKVNKNRKLITDLNDDKDEEITRSSDGLSKRATLFFDQPLFRKVMEECDESKKNSEHSKTRKLSNDMENSTTESEKYEDEKDVKNFQVFDSACNKSLKRKAEAVRKSKEN